MFYKYHYECKQAQHNQFPNFCYLATHDKNQNMLDVCLRYILICIEIHIEKYWAAQDQKLSFKT